MIGKPVNAIHVMSHALFRLGLKLSRLNEIESELQTWMSCLDQIPRLKKFILSRRVPMQFKLDVFEKSLFPFFDKTIQIFLTLLIQKKLIWLYKDIFDSFCKLKDKHQGILRSQLESATQLGNDNQAQIQNYLEKRWNKTVRLSSTINSSLLGGLKLMTGDVQIDFSLRTKLEQLKKSIHDKQISGVVYED